MRKQPIPEPEDMDPDRFYCEMCDFDTKSESKAIAHAKKVHGRTEE